MRPPFLVLFKNHMSVFGKKRYKISFQKRNNFPKISQKKKKYFKNTQNLIKNIYIVLFMTQYVCYNESTEIEAHESNK